MTSPRKSGGRTGWGGATGPVAIVTLGAVLTLRMESGAQDVEVAGVITEIKAGSGQVEVKPAGSFARWRR